MTNGLDDARVITDSEEDDKEELKLEEKKEDETEDDYFENPMDHMD